MMYVWYAEPPSTDFTIKLIEECTLDKFDNTGWSALHYAASNPFVNLETLELLVDNASQFSKDG
jgi:predicted N-acyltransferase